MPSLSLLYSAVVVQKESFAGYSWVPKFEFHIILRHKRLLFDFSQPSKNVKFVALRQCKNKQQLVLG